MPFGLPTDSSAIKSPVAPYSFHSLAAENLHPQMVSRIVGCFPPGPRFIRLATRSSLALHACLLKKLSNAKTAISCGKNLFWKICIAFQPSFRHFHHPSSLLPLPYLMNSVAKICSCVCWSKYRNRPWEAHKNTDTIRPYPRDLGLSHSLPAFLHEYEGLSLALKVLSSCCRRLVPNGRRFDLLVVWGFLRCHHACETGISVWKSEIDSR